jgi:uncharacterized repeat protein (TIGR03803 family)
MRLSRFFAVTFVLLASSLVLICSSAAQTVTNILNFNGTDGQRPTRTTPAQGRDGRLYGTTYYGGTYGAGTIWAVETSGSASVFYSFDGVTATTPQSGLTLATDGNLYGVAGSPSGDVLYRVTPAGALSVLHTFGKTDGCYPASPPIEASDGNLYGTTMGCGRSTLYRYTPAGVFTTIQTFVTATQGKDSFASPMQASDGSLWGTNGWGGTDQCGAVFKTALSGTVLQALLMDCTDQRHPSSPLIQAADGNIYGTSSGGGKDGAGSVFELNANGALSTVYEFQSGSDLEDPVNIMQATDGSFYGTAYGSGTDRDGGIYKIDGSGNYSVIYDFTTGSPHIVEVSTGLMQHTTGEFYGASGAGGIYRRGSVFSLDMGLGPFIGFVRPTGTTGSVAQILGQGLTGTTNVTFNGVVATSFSVVSDTYMTAVVPTGATTGPVVVTTSGGALTSNVSFRIID